MICEKSLDNPEFLVCKRTARLFREAKRRKQNECRWKVGGFSGGMEGGPSSKLVENADSALTFSPQGKQIAFVRRLPADSSNVHALNTRKSPQEFALAPTGGPPRQLAHSTSGLFFGFDVSRGGQQSIARVTDSSDVVLIRHFQ